MSETGWNIGDLRDHYNRMNAGKASSAYAPALMSSMGRSFEIMRYHLKLAKNAANGIFNEDDPAGPDNMFLILGGDTEKQPELQRAKIVSEANIITLVLTVRAMGDIFAQLVHDFLISPRLKEREVNIHAVTNELDHLRLKSHLQGMLASDSFGYVNALANTTKHRQLVPHVINLSLEQNSVGLAVGAFQYGKDYAQQPAKAAIQMALDVANAIVGAGRLLNEHVIDGAAGSTKPAHP